MMLMLILNQNKVRFVRPTVQMLGHQRMSGTCDVSHGMAMRWQPWCGYEVLAKGWVCERRSEDRKVWIWLDRKNNCDMDYLLNMLYIQYLLYH